jgi:hypothetical protein
MQRRMVAVLATRQLSSGQESLGAALGGGIESDPPLTQPPMRHGHVLPERFAGRLMRPRYEEVAPLPGLSEPQLTMTPDEESGAVNR